MSDARVLDALDHVILGVGDLAAATRQYVRLLGRTPSWRGEHPSAGTANVLFRVDNTYLELLAPAGSGPVGNAVAARLDAVGDGPLGLAFGTPDAEACRAAFEQRGLSPGPVENGLGRDTESGAFREWKRVPLPLERTRGVLIFAIEHTSPPESLPPAGLLADEASAVYGLDHAVVRTEAPDAARDLYRDGLGLRLALDQSFPQWRARLLFFRVGGVTVELAASLPDADGASAADPADAALRPATDRLWGLTWQVSDADATRARIADAGFDVSPVRKGRRPGSRVFSVRDGTCGVPTLMIEPAASDA